MPLSLADLGAVSLADFRPTPLPLSPTLSASLFLLPTTPSLSPTLSASLFLSPTTPSLSPTLSASLLLDDSDGSIGSDPTPMARKDYFVLKESSNPATVKKLFFDYGKANWSKCAKVDPNFASDPNSKPPDGHPRLALAEWRVFCTRWNSKYWKKLSAQGKANRNTKSVKLKPCSGKIPREERLDSQEEQSTEPRMLRALDTCHKRKDGTWSSEKAEAMHANYLNALEKHVEEIEETTGVRPPLHEVDKNLGIYLRIDGGANHGRMTCMSRIHVSTVSHPIGEDTSERLRNVEEDLRKSQEQLRQTAERE